MIALFSWLSLVFLQTNPNCKVYGQIYEVDDPMLAHYIVYEETSESFADIVVFEQSNSLYADKPGMWFFEETKESARYFVYFTNQEREAHFSVYFTRFESFAGCNQ